MHQESKSNKQLIWGKKGILAKAWPYMVLMRLNCPTGFFLLLLPCFWGLALAGARLGNWYLYALFFLGALLMRSAGCIINDLADRKLDGHVARTAARPLASKVISLKSAFVTLGVLLNLSLLILLQFNKTTIILGFLSMVLVILYPFMKRLTYWPQAFLGLTFNWGVLMGWTAVHNTFSWSSLLLYMAGIFWTLGYDTLYAAQDMKDDIKVGIKSSALKLGRHTLKWLYGFYGLMTLSLLLLGFVGGFGKVYYAVIAFVGFRFLGLLRKVNLRSPLSCLETFKMNVWMGFLIFIGILVA